jgi:hypothetical protein
VSVESGRLGYIFQCIVRVPERIIDADLFFNLKTAEATIRDPDGMDLRDELSARKHARTVACELMRHREALTRSWRLDVRDGDGRQCFDLLFATVDKAPRRARGHAMV